jgi:hypothetical protein
MEGSMSSEPQLDIEMTVNGKPVDMNEFVQKITANVLLGVIKSLRLTEEPKTAVFNLKIK